MWRNCLWRDCEYKNIDVTSLKRWELAPALGALHLDLHPLAQARPVELVPTWPPHYPERHVQVVG